MVDVYKDGKDRLYATRMHTTVGILGNLTIWGKLLKCVPPRRNSLETPKILKIIYCVRKYALYYSGTKSPHEAIKSLKEFQERADC